MRLSGYMDDPIELDLLALKHGMQYFMHHTNEPIMYSRNKSFKTHKILHQCFFKSGDA